nr:hypothetical protein [Tanacetum cinerariifolium]
MHMLTKPKVFYDDTHKQALGYQNPFYLKKAQRIKPTLYDGSVISSQHVVIPVIDDGETLILEEVNFGKRFVPQQELSTEQAFWLQTSHPNTDQSASSPVKIEAPREPPKFDNVLPVQNTFLDDNIALDVLKMENDRLMELLISQGLVHTVVNSLAAINDYKSMERSYIEEYERNLKLAAELSQINELSKTCSRLEQRYCLLN